MIPLTLKGESFARKNFREVQNLRNFKNKLSQMISNDAFCEYLPEVIKLDNF